MARRAKKPRKKTACSGGKSKYPSHVEPKLDLIEAWSRDGLSLEQIAAKLGIAESTLRKYRDTHEPLAAALARGREVCDIEVENALHKKALGYNASITKHYKVKVIEYDPDTGRKVSEREELVAVQDEVHVPADTEAAKWWLSNRDRQGKWEYKPEPKMEDQEGETGVVELSAQDPEPEPPPELVAQAEAEIQEGGGHNG